MRVLWLHSPQRSVRGPPRALPIFDELIAKAEAKAPARSLVSIDDVGVAVAFRCMNRAKLVTGDALYIDGGYHIID